MAGLTQPLEFRKFQRSMPHSGFDAVPFFDALLIALFVAINLSSFITPPGTTIQLPVSPSVTAPPGVQAAVLTVDRNQLFFFEGLKLTKDSLQPRLQAYTERFPAREALLLIKADASIQASVLFELMDIARGAGFDRVHLAAEPETLNLPVYPSGQQLSLP